MVMRRGRGQSASSSSSSSRSRSRSTRGRRSSTRGRSRSRSRSRVNRRPRGRVSRSPPGNVRERLQRLNVSDTSEGRNQAEEGLQIQANDSDNSQIGILKRALAEQQQTLENILADTKQEIFDKVEDGKDKHKFKQRRLEQQYEVNHNFQKIVKRSLSCLEKGYTDKVRAYLEELDDSLEEHREDLIAADLSRNEWLAVQHLRNRSALPSSFLKKLERLDKFLDDSRKKENLNSRNGRFANGVKEMDKNPQKNDVRTYRPFGPKKSPEETLNEASRQTRAGKCGHCQGEGHFFRECPAFWSKALEGRKNLLFKN